MDKDVRNGCLIGCGILAVVTFFSWLITIGGIWLICLLLSPFGVAFDIAMATAAWVALLLLGMFFSHK